MLDLLLQFLDVFHLKVTNQANRGLSALRVLFDPQFRARFETSSPCGASGVPAGLIESEELTSRGMADCSEMLILQKNSAKPLPAPFAVGEIGRWSGRAQAVFDSKGEN